MSHFELTAETKNVGVAVLHRIRATRDIPRYGVKAGDLGGWVEKAENISSELGEAWVADEAYVFGDALVSGNAWVFGNAHVFGNAYIFGVGRVAGAVRMGGDAWVSHRLHILTATIVTTTVLDATLARTKTGWQMEVGCWYSTEVSALRTMAESDTWVATTGADCDEARGELLAFAALAEARVERVARLEAKAGE